MSEDTKIEVTQDFLDKVAEYKGLAESIRSDLVSENDDLKARVAVLEKQASTLGFDERDAKLVLTHLASICGRLPESIDKEAEVGCLRDAPGRIVDLLEKCAEAQRETARNASILRLGAPGERRETTKEAGEDKASQEWQRATQELADLVGRNG